jgi:hypothetical protein
LVCAEGTFDAVMLLGKAMLVLVRGECLQSRLSWKRQFTKTQARRGTLYGSFPFVFRSMSQLVRRIGARLGSANSFGVLSAE